MSKQVKFYWWKSYKVWKVSGKDIDEITARAEKLAEKYHALHYEVL